jgi:hypothetical protein
MKYREQLQQEINQAESQLKKLEKLERSKMREQNNFNKEILENLTEETGNGKNAEGEKGKPTRIVKNGNDFQITNKEG